MAMGTWKAKIIGKKRIGSQTPGRQKGEHCQADAFKKSMAKRSRSYKDPAYGKWCAQMDSMNGRAKAG